MNPTPYIDRKELLRDISSFVRRNGGTFRQLAKRMSDLFEMTIYNDVIKYYKRKKCAIEIHKLKRDGTFKYKLSTSGLAENFSYFTIISKKSNCDKSLSKSYEIHHNIKVQSAHDKHIYFTADISVCNAGGTKTIMQKNGRRHSFIENEKLINFFEVKNMNPFPEVLFSFSGLVLEIMPQFIEKTVLATTKGDHLTPSLIFSGTSSAHAEKVCESLKSRYNYNIISGLYVNKSQVYSFKNLHEYCP